MTREELIRAALCAGKITVTEGDSTTDEVEKLPKAENADEVEKLPEGEHAEEKKAHTRVSHNIVFVTAEAAPYSKTGGLADVCGSLPIALVARGHRVMVISPRYIHDTPEDLKYSAAVDLEHCVKLFCFGGVQEVGFFHEYREGVDWV